MNIEHNDIENDDIENDDNLNAYDFGSNFDEGEAFNVADIMDDEGFGGSVDDMASNGGIDFG